MRKPSVGNQSGKQRIKKPVSPSRSSPPGVSLCKTSTEGIARDLDAPHAPGAVAFADHQRIIIKGPRAFVAQTAAHLAGIARLPLGRELFASLERSGKTVTIVPAARMSEAPPEDFRGALARGRILRWVNEWGQEKVIRGRGTGSDTTISYNPNLTDFGGEPWQRQPPEIGLAHELIHADDAAHGRMDPEKTDGVRHYEFQAIGLDPYQDKQFTENKFRAAWPDPQPPRPRY